MKIFFLHIAFILFSFSVSFSQLRLITPSLDDTLFIGEEFNITWEGNGQIPVNLEYSTDDGRNWNTIAEDISGTSYPWKPDYTDSLNVIMRVGYTYLKKPYLLWEKLNAHSGEIRSVEISPSGKFILSASPDGYVKIHDMSGNKVDEIYMTNVLDTYKAVFFHNSDSVLIAADQYVFLWDRLGGNLTKLDKFDFNDLVKTVAAHPTLPIIAAGGFDGLTQLIDLSDDSWYKNYQAMNNIEIRSLAFNWKGDYLSRGISDGRIFVSEWSNSDPGFILSGHGDNNLGNIIWDLAFSKDGKYLVSGGVDGTTRVWDIENQIEIAKFERDFTHVRTVDFHTGGNYVLSAGLDSSLFQYDLQDMKEFEEVRINHGAAVLSCKYSPTSDTIVSGGRDFAIRVWRNFEFITDSDSREIPIRYRIPVRIPHLASYPGERIHIPVITDDPKDFPQVLSHLKNAEIRFGIPKYFLYLLEDNITKTKGIRKDTLLIKADEFLPIDTVAEVEAYTLLGDGESEDIPLIDFSIDDELIVFDLEDGSITILNDCEGEDERRIAIAGDGASLNAGPNPFDEAINIYMNFVEDGRHSLKLLDVSGRLLKEFFAADFAAGKYDMFFYIGDIPGRIFILRLETPSKILEMKIAGNN